MNFLSLAVASVLVVAAFILVTASVKILREYERAVVFTMGRSQKVKGPGLVLLVPFIQEMVRVDLRIQVQNYLPATNMLAQTTLRAVLGQHELDEMPSERKKLSVDVQSILDAQTETWGIKVSNVEIRTVELTDNMVKAIAKQAEAERDRRAQIIHAEAEFQASQTLVNAAKILSSIPAAMDGYGYGYIAPMGVYPAGGPAGIAMGYQSARPGYEIRSLLASAHILARHGQQQACESVLATTQGIYKVYTADLHDGNMPMTNVDEWRQRQIAGAQPVTDKNASFRSDELIGTDVRSYLNAPLPVPSILTSFGGEEVAIPTSQM